MANPEHRAQINAGGIVWNEWRTSNPTIQPDLSGADLSMATAREGAASRALVTLGFGGGIHDLSGMDLSGSNLTGADLTGQILTGANLRGADLTGANLSHAHLVEADLRDAKLNECRVYGISIWNVDLTGAEQANIFINPDKEPTITVDYLEVAQFIYLLLNNAKIRNVIDSITSKAVLILGRFTPDRKAILDALRAALRAKAYLAILFDFDKPSSRDLTELCQRSLTWRDSSLPTSLTRRVSHRKWSVSYQTYLPFRCNRCCNYLLTSMACSSIINDILGSWSHFGTPRSRI